MTQSFYELVLKPTGFKNELIDFLFSLGIEAIEESEDDDKNDIIILRCEDNAELLAFGATKFVEKLNAKFGKSEQLQTCITQKDNIDWIRKYQQSIQAIQIGKFYIHPTWQKPKDDCVNVIIDPALAFGSGHHESTNSCILGLEKYLKKDQYLLDLGTGSGILAIIAAKIGAKVDACDTDELSVQNASQNALLNDVNFHDIWLGSINKTDKTYDFIVANIIADILIFLHGDLKTHLKSGGILILSGILDKYENKVLKAFEDFKIIEIFAQNQWRSIVLEKK